MNLGKWMAEQVTWLRVDVRKDLVTLKVTKNWSYERLEGSAHILERHIFLLFKRYILVDIRVLMDALFCKVLIISISLYVQESLKKKCALQPGLKLHSPLL